VLAAVPLCPGGELRDELDDSHVRGNLSFGTGATARRGIADLPSGDDLAV